MKYHICILQLFILTIFCLTACHREGADDFARETPEESAPAMSLAPTPELEPTPEPTPELPISLSFTGPQLDTETEEDDWYWWGREAIWIDSDTLLFRWEYFYGGGSEKFLQEIIYTASAPDYTPKELMRLNCKERPRLDKFIPLDDGAAFELDGILYQYSGKSGEIKLLVDMRDFLGENYYFSPWSLKQNYDLSSDGEWLLLCTDEGLYEYSLLDHSGRLLVKSDYQPVEIVHIEGDCDCGETGFTFSGPIYAEYSPDEQTIACLIGEEYGGPLGITLIDREGNSLYTYETDSYSCEFLYLEDEAETRLAVFDHIYHSEFSDYKYEIQIVYPLEETIPKYELPEKVYKGLRSLSYACVGPIAKDTLLYFDGCMKTFCFSTGEEKVVFSDFDDIIDLLDTEKYFDFMPSPDGEKILLLQEKDTGLIIPLFYN